MTVALRRPTNHNGSNATDNPFEAGGTRHCMSCNKWRSQAGGRIHPRTRFWQCAGCRPLVLPTQQIGD